MLVFKPGVRPQPAEGQLWARAWFKVCVCVCMYVSIFVCLSAPA